VTTTGSVGGRDRLRLFCALRLPDNVLDAIEAWQHAHLSGGRIVPREHLHVTLAFLGSTPTDRLDEIKDALRAAAARAKPIEFLLPARRLRETRSVAMLVLRDLHGSGLALAEDLFTRLEALDVYEREKRGWLPHITVLRFRTPPKLDLEPDLGRFARFGPSDAAVYSSALRPSGAQYEVLESVPLGG
jgi:RNA 2',3'-cyclic 3'-phosphodiesterase